MSGLKQVCSHMSLPFALALGALIAANLGIIWFLLAAPAGVRTTVNRMFIPASPEKVWSAMYPLGANALWDGSYKKITPLAQDRVELDLDWEGRDGKPIRRTLELSNVVENAGYFARVVDDTSLDHSFWANHSEHVALKPHHGGTEVTVRETDSYKGYAFYFFRYFKNRRSLVQLKHWAKTGEFKSAALFEKLPVQIGMGVLSALALWPFFGLTPTGLTLSVLLTFIVALHEFGHLFAFRIMGHKKVRMIFIPVLGGIAVGGRPYDKHFEVAFSALMGPAFSAFPVGAALAAYAPLVNAGHQHAATMVGGFATIAALFNLANLVPMWKFDGGQVIRQLYSTRLGQGVAAFVLLGGLLAVCAISGFSTQALLITGTVFAILSLVTNNSGVKPKAALHPMSDREKLLILAGLMATFTIHATGVIWGISRYL